MSTITFLTQVELENLFQLATLLSLGLDPADYKPDLLDPDKIIPPIPVRISWPQDGMPGFDITENVIFIRVGEQDQDVNRQVNVITAPIAHDTNNMSEVIGRTRVLNVTWICYGPLAYDNATRIFNSLPLPVFHNTLSPGKIFLVPVAESPVRRPELYNGQWWNRADFQAQFNNKVESGSTIPYIQSADVKIINERGEIIGDS